MRTKIVTLGETLQKWGGIRKYDGRLNAKEWAITLKHLLNAPFIYGMVMPFVLFHLCLEIYHRVCFYLYGIPYVRWSDYIIIDRHKLERLTPMQKAQCVYCGYANGLLAYAQEIAGRTERYWCPLKHQSEPRNTHAHYEHFLERNQQHRFETFRKTDRKRWCLDQA